METGSMVWWIRGDGSQADGMIFSVLPNGMAVVTTGVRGQVNEMIPMADLHSQD